MVILRPKQIDQDYSDNIFRCNFLMEFFHNLIQIQGYEKVMTASDNTKMTWQLTGEEPLPEPMMIQFIDEWVIWPQYIR